MKHRIMTYIFLLSVVSITPYVMADDPDSLIVMQDGLNEIKADFNEAVDQVRLVFIVGPT